MRPFFESSRNAGVLRDDKIPSLGDYCKIGAMFLKQWQRCNGNPKQSKAVPKLF